MGIYRRKGSGFWYIRIGRSIDRSSGTASRSEALALEAKWRREQWRRDKMGEEPEGTFGEAAAAWAEEVGQHRKGWERDWYRLQRLYANLGNLPVSAVDERSIRAAIPPSAKAPASRNHYLSLARSILRHASRAGDLVIVPPIRMERTRNARVRYLRDWHEAERLVNAMPAHWQDPARFSLLTGVRQGTLRALRRQWISRDMIVIPGSHTKSGRTLPLPLSTHALDVVDRQPIREHVFTRPDGSPLGRMEHKVWKKVLKRSGVEDFRWHDIRHTWASWMMMTGEVTLYELQQLGDWSTPAMVQRYAHLAPDYLRGVVDRASAELPRTGQDSAPVQGD